MADTSPLSELPIVQAPMAGGPSTPALTAAVSGAGGFGFLAAGYLSPARLAEVITETRALTESPFGVNLFFPSTPAEPGPVLEYAAIIKPESERLGVALGEPRWDDDAFDEKIHIVESARVAVVSFTFGCPTAPTMEQLQRAGCKVGVTVTSPLEAQVAERAGADLLVVQGTEAGGHQGTFLSLHPHLTPLRSLLEEVREVTRIPMVGCGGVMTGSDAAAVLRAGASAVALGTAFLCCPEAGTSDTYRRALLERRYDETVITRAFSGRYARGLANEFALAYGDAAPGAYPEVHHLTRPLRAAATKAGDPGTPNLWAGQGWRHVTTEPAATILHRIAAELRAG